MKKFLIHIVSPLNSPLTLVVVAFVFFSLRAHDITGDLGRLGQILFSQEYHEQSKFDEGVDKQIDWCGTDELGRYDVVVIGDSFTIGCYPYYLKKALGEKVAKYVANNTSPVQTFVSLCNAGVEMPPVVVVECVERNLVLQLNKLCLDPQSSPFPKAEAYKPEILKQTDFLTFYKNQIIDTRAVKHLHLRDSLFSCPNKERELYFYHEDLLFPLEEQLPVAASRLETVFKMAHARQIQLFFVIAADKYDVYQDFAVDNIYPEKTMLDAFASFEGNPYFVNTRPLLNRKVREGVVDVYYADDTHWSPVGAKMVAEEIAGRIKEVSEK